VVVVVVVITAVIVIVVMVVATTCVRACATRGGRVLCRHAAIENPEAGLESRATSPQGSNVKIGELASATDTPVETIRFYEREGLIPAPARTGSNYRSYAPAHTQRLAFIRRCRALDMGLDEVRVLLQFQDRPSDDCGEVNAVLDEHIGHVTQRIRELRQLEQQLHDLRARCASTRSGPACGILEQLNTVPVAVDGVLSPSPNPAQVHAHVGPVHGRLGARPRG
jgi:Cd(II)/Pb(II)-responsive transcriptional regulator